MCFKQIAFSIAIDGLSIIWKSDRYNEIETGFLPSVAVSVLLYRCTTLTLTRRMEKKLDENYTNMRCAFF